MALESAPDKPETFYFQNVQVRCFVRNFEPLLSYVIKRQFAT